MGELVPMLNGANVALPRSVTGTLWNGGGDCRCWMAPAIS